MFNKRRYSLSFYGPNVAALGLFFTFAVHQKIHTNESIYFVFCMCAMYGAGRYYPVGLLRNYWHCKSKWQNACGG